MGLEILRPHIETIINDNSYVTQEVVNNSSVLFQPYVSDMGESGKIIKYTSLSEFITKNGNPNFRKHGQSIYNIVNWLRAGGVVYGYRITAEDSTFANLILNIKTKKETITDDDSEEKQVLKTKLDLDSKELTELSQVKEVLENVAQYPNLDEQGYKNHPIFSFYVNGKGVYGNDFSIDLRPNYSQQTKYDFRTYSLTLKRRDERGLYKTVEGPFIVSLHPDSTDASGSSMFIKDIVETFSKQITVEFNDEAYYTLMAEIMEFEPKDANGLKLIEKEIDYLFCRSLEKDLDLGGYKQYDFMEVETESFGFDGLNGKSLGAGSDGQFAVGVSGRTDAINKQYENAFSPEKTPEIKNKKVYPFEVVLDANYSATVKQRIADLARERQDFVAILDMGLQTSYEKTLEFKRTNLNFDSMFCFYFGQTYTVADTYTTVDIPVTFTYFLASMIPAHDTKHGVQYPIAGPARGIVTGFKPNTINFNPDDDQQEELYGERINYIVEDPDGTEIATNLTSQVATSALSSINNVRVLIRIIKQIEKRARVYRHEFNDEMTLSNFAADLKIIESEWTNNRACTSLTITPYQTDYDVLQKTCRVAVSVVFNGTIERIIIEVSVEN